MLTSINHYCTNFDKLVYLLWTDENIPKYTAALAGWRMMIEFHKTFARLRNSTRQKTFIVVNRISNWTHTTSSERRQVVISSSHKMLKKKTWSSLWEIKYCTHHKQCKWEPIYHKPGYILLRHPGVTRVCDVNQFEDEVKGWCSTKT